MVRIPTDQYPEGFLQLQVAEVLDEGIKRDNPNISKDEAWEQALQSAIGMTPVAEQFLDGHSSFFDVSEEVNGVKVKLTSHRIEEGKL